MKLYGYPEVVPYTPKTGTAPESVNPDLIMGMELEMEGLRGMRFDDDGIHWERDGSLRNDGMEGITAAMPHKYMVPFLKNFFGRNKITEANYSERCSTHVHVNAASLTFEQIGSICLTYQIVENLLFKFIAHERGQNIFCVPWSEAGISYKFVNQLSANPAGVVRAWQKYSALNLLPLGRQGSMEFRHLHGTCDLVLIGNWLNLIGRLFEYGTTTKLDDLKKLILDMNTISNYTAWLEDVFKKETQLILCQDHQTILSAGVVDAKCMLMEDPPKKKAPGLKWDDAFQMVEPNLEQVAAEIQVIRARNAQAQQRRQREEVAGGIQDLVQAQRDIIQRQRAERVINPAPMIRNRNRG